VESDASPESLTSRVRETIAHSVAENVLTLTGFGKRTAYIIAIKQLERKSNEEPSGVST